MLQLGKWALQENEASVGQLFDPGVTSIQYITRESHIKVTRINEMVTN